jgi:hypothetical protein
MQTAKSASIAAASPDCDAFDPHPATASARAPTTYVENAQRGRRAMDC